MSIISVLDPFVSNQIAAGEVVERPSSVVKELVENCIDAGASAVTVDIMDGGLTSIKVTDNGCGMEPDDASCAFLRHATSKIHTADDLTGIATLGFRGEALAAIASVSRIKMWTRPKSVAFGTRIELEGGNITVQEPFGAPEGTSITVCDLFYNTPARKKFMKRPHVEAGYVQETVLRAILSRPDISFRFTSQGRTIYYSSGDGSLENALSCVYAKEVRGLLRPVKGRLPNGSFEGFIGDISLSRTNRKREHIAINGRPVNCFAVSLAVESAFDTQLMVHKFPLFALHLHVPNDAVDVNVHPSKLEVRLRDESGITQAITSAIAPVVLKQENPFASLYRQKATETGKARMTSDVLFSSSNATPKQPNVHDAINAAFRPQESRVRSTFVAARDTSSNRLPSIAQDGTKKREAAQESGAACDFDFVLRKDRDAQTPYEAIIDTQPSEKTETTVKNAPSSPIEEQKSSFDTSSAFKAPAPQKPQQETLFEDLPQKEQETVKPVTFHVIGQLFATYLLVEAGTKFLVVDQHAAHERLLFDRYCAQFDRGEVIRQPLIVPYVETLSAQEMETLLEHRALLETLGFTIEEFGPLTIMVRSVPMILGEAQMDKFLHETLAFLQKRTDVKTSSLKHLQIATIACKAAIKAGDVLTPAEIDELMSLIAEHQGALTCPHGRPIYFEMSKYEVEKRFKRV